MISIGLIIILIILLFGGNGSNGGGGPQINTDRKPKSLDDIADTDSQVRMTVAGNVRANQEYREIKVTINRNVNTLQIIHGYENDVVDSKDFSNNQAAFETFLRALTGAGYMEGNDSKELADDRGHCPLGLRYIFEIIENGQTVQRYWSTSCGGVKTYHGRTSLTTDLFEMQIPDYSSLTSDVDF